MSDDPRDNPELPELDEPKHARPELEGPEKDALEAEAASAAAASDTFEQAGGAEREPDGGVESEGAEEEMAESTPETTAKLERLQKILAQAGIASRRHA